MFGSEKQKREKLLKSWKLKAKSLILKTASEKRKQKFYDFAFQLCIQLSPYTISLILVTVRGVETEIGDLDVDHLWCSFGLQKIVYTIWKHAYVFQHFPRRRASVKECEQITTCIQILWIQMVIGPGSFTDVRLLGKSWNKGLQHSPNFFLVESVASTIDNVVRIITIDGQLAGYFEKLFLVHTYIH